MPGIAGRFRKAQFCKDANEIHKMIECMIHENFYRSGTYINPELGLDAGWVCQKDSFSDCMPVWNENRDICLIMSGEAVAAESKIRRLQIRGHAFTPDNASFLVHLYEEEDIEFLDELNGSFSGILADLRKQRAILFNDRFGLNRIYYYENESGIYFSSEAKSLLRVIPGLRQIDYAGLGEYFSCGCTLENKTLYRGIALVPNGSVWSFSPFRKTVKDVFIKPERWENQTLLSHADFFEKMKSTFSQIMTRHVRPSERIAISLTGGIDTRMMMAWAPLSPFQVPCYTFSGMYRDCADVKIARRVADVCLQRHTTIRVAGDFLSEFPSLAQRTVYLTDGVMDVSGAVELYVNRLAREIAPIRLTGNYGDQVIRRAIGLRPRILLDRIFDRDFVRQIHAGVRTSEMIERGPALSFFGFKLMPWVYYSRQALERTQLTMRSPYLDHDLIALMYQAPPDMAASIDCSLRLIAEGSPALGRIPTDRGRRYRSIPFVTPAQRVLRELAFKAEYVYDYGMPQWLVKFDHRLDKLNLGRAFIGRHKFYHFRMWYKNELSKFVREILLDPRTLHRPYLNASGIESIVAEHTKGFANHTLEIHALLSSELMHRHLVESIGDDSCRDVGTI